MGLGLSLGYEKIYACMNEVMLKKLIQPRIMPKEVILKKLKEPQLTLKEIVLKKLAPTLAIWKMKHKSMNIPTRFLLI